MTVIRLRLLCAGVITWTAVWCTGALLALAPAVIVAAVTGGSAGWWVLLAGWGVSSAAAAWTACEVVDRLRPLLISDERMWQQISTVLGRTDDAEGSGPPS